jgi:hypothetical protein
MKKETVKLKNSSMQFVDENCFAAVTFADDEKKKPVLEMVGYSGGIIKNHWYWGDLAIDLQGMSFPKKKFPILQEHSTALKIGFATKMSIEGNKLTVEKSEFVDTPESIKFRETSAQGFPYEASIFAKPTKIQRLLENEEAEVNGYKMKGPGTIWRASTFKEVSVCTFGYDSNTSAVAMAEAEDVEIEYISENKAASQFKGEEENKSMDYLKFKAEFPGEFAKLAADVAAEVAGKFTEEKQALETKISALTEEVTQLSAEVKESEKKVLSYEKAEAARVEESIKLKAEAVFAEKFKESGLPERLEAKVKRLVGHEAFVADGKLDAEAFGAAIDAELKDWTGDSSVMGFSTSTKELGNEDTNSLKAADEAAARMLKYVNS